MKIAIDIVVEKDGEAFYAHCSSFPCVHTGGETREEAADMAEKCIIGVIAEMVEHGEPLVCCQVVIPARYAIERGVSIAHRVIELPMTGEYHAVHQACRPRKV
jgi:predicted RNase H-like HicB family nuclease